MINLKPLIPLLFCCLLISCQDQTAQERAIDNQLRSIHPSETHTAEPTPSIVPTATSSPTATSTIFPPTLTPLPLVPTEDLETFISELLENNTGCKLPCLWGIVPGETTWKEASQFLNTFSRTSYSVENQAGFASVRSPIGHGDESFTIQYTFLVTDGLITSIEFYNWPKLSSWHYLSKILSEYGPPDEVGLYTEGKQYTGSRVSSLILFYADLGFMMEYVSFREVKALGDKVLFCPDGNYSFSYMWSKELDYSFDQAITIYSPVYESAAPRPMGEVSDMDIQSFYHAFRDPNSSACIETELEAWPHFLD